MQPINQFLIFEFGAKVRAVSALPDAVTLQQAAGALFQLKPALEGLLVGKPILLDYSIASVRDALASTTSLIEATYFKDSKLDFEKDWNDAISPWYLQPLRTSLVRLEHNLAAEFEKTATYLVAKTTSFDTAILIERACETLTPEVRSQLNAMAEFDYTQAGRCLGFGLYTAAGFHIARATEAVMISYCETFVGALEDEDKHTWGQVLGTLTKVKTEPKPDKSTIAILEQIKNVDRNDLMHPKKSLDLTEATRLFYLATGAIIAMAMEMRSKNQLARQQELFAEQPKLLPSVET